LRLVPGTISPLLNRLGGAGEVTHQAGQAPPLQHPQRSGRAAGRWNTFV